MNQRINKRGYEKNDVEKSLRFIDAVREKPVLWQKSHKNYKNIVLKNDAWAEIAVKENMSPRESKMLWKKLLGCYRSNKAKIRNSLKRGAAYDDAYVPRWFGFQAMAFLGEATEDAVHVETLPQDDSLGEEETDLGTVTLVNLPYYTLVCKSSDKLTTKPLETSPSTCPQPQTQLANALPIVPRSQPWTVRVVRTIPKQMEDPLQIKPKSQTQPLQVGTQTSTFPNRGSLGGSLSLLKSFVNLIEHELAELPKDYATMAQMDIYKIIGEYKLKDVERRSTQNPKLAASKTMYTKVVQEKVTEYSVPTSIKIEPSKALENNDEDAP